MGNQQTKRRRKRYQPGSAFAGDVRPTGVLSLIGGTTAMKVIFLIMALGLAGGGLYGIFRTSASTSDGKNTNYVLPTGTASAAGTAQPTFVAKHYTSLPAMTIDPAKKYIATIHTQAGDIQVSLFADQAPQTVNNFVFLAKDGFYNGLTFWQVVPNFDAQAGDPNCQAGKTGGCAGSGDPGYQLSQEKPGARYDAGTVGMANASQFFIALANSDKFSAFTPFGKIISGLEIAQQITPGTAIDSIEIQQQ